MEQGRTSRVKKAGCWRRSLSGRWVERTRIMATIRVSMAAGDVFFSGRGPERNLVTDTGRLVGQSGIALYHSLCILVALFPPDASWPMDQDKHTTRVTKIIKFYQAYGHARQPSDGTFPFRVFELALFKQGLWSQVSGH